MDVNADAVTDAFRKHRVTRIIHGHIHRCAQYALTVDGRPCERYVLGDWPAGGNLLRVSSAGCAFEELPLPSTSAPAST